MWGIPGLGLLMGSSPSVSLSELPSRSLRGNTVTSCWRTGKDKVEGSREVSLSKDMSPPPPTFQVIPTKGSYLCSWIGWSQCWWTNQHQRWEASSVADQRVSMRVFFWNFTISSLKRIVFIYCFKGLSSHIWNILIGPLSWAICTLTSELLTYIGLTFRIVSFLCIWRKSYFDKSTCRCV